MQRVESSELKINIGFLAYIASKELTKLYSLYLRPYKLTYKSYLTLTLLPVDKATNVNSVATKLHLDHGTVAPITQQLLNSNLIIKERDSSDSRYVNLLLTNEGQEMQNQIRLINKRVEDRINLTKEELETLQHLLFKLVNNL